MNLKPYNDLNQLQAEMTDYANRLEKILKINKYE